MYDRRQFLRFLAASPLLASAGFTIDPFNLVPRQNTIDASLFETLDKTGGNVITSADQALDVMEFEPVARKVLPPPVSMMMPLSAQIPTDSRTYKSGLVVL